MARSIALRSGIRLELLTVGWMTLEAVVAIGAGIAAMSTLLTAFGADSLIELLSGATLLWRLRVDAGAADRGRVEAAERKATRISALLLVLLCLYVVGSSAVGLLLRLEPDKSWVGIAVSALALAVMPWLAARKRAVNATLQSPALRADIVESATCAYLAVVTLVGLVISAFTGWWWIQYLAALALLWWLIPEAREAFKAGREINGDAEHDS